MMTDEQLRIECCEQMGWQAHGAPFWSKPDEEILVEGSHKLPPYESSLDAAMQLVAALKKEGWSFMLDNINTGWCAVFLLVENGTGRHEATDENPARAVCLAFLEVRRKI